MYILENGIGQTFSEIDRRNQVESLKKFDFNNQKVLDLGCGRYKDISFLFANNPKMIYTGIDYDQDRIDTFMSYLSDNIKVKCKSIHDMDYEKEVKPFDIILYQHPDNFFPCRSLTSLNNSSLLKNFYKFVNDGKRILIYPSSIAPLYYKDTGESIYWYVPYDKICEIIDLCFSNLFTVRQVNGLVELTKSDFKMEI